MDGVLLSALVRARAVGDTEALEALADRSHGGARLAILDAQSWLCSITRQRFLSFAAIGRMNHFV